MWWDAQAAGFIPLVPGAPSHHLRHPLPILVVISALHAPRWLCNDQDGRGHAGRWAVEGLAYLTFDADGRRVCGVMQLL